MGFFIRKSTKVGPFRINLSKSGLGLSAGVTGARVSVGPNGTFVHLGRHGMYYRKKISTPNKKGNIIEEVSLEELYSVSNDVTKIETTNFDGITDVDSQDFIDNLQKQDRKVFLYKWLGILPLCIYLLFLLLSSSDKIIGYNEETSSFVINTNGANIRARSSTKSKIIKVAKKNDKLELIDTSSNWYRVRIENFEAFVHNSVGSIENKTVSEAKVLNVGSNYSWLPILVFLVVIILLYQYDKKRKRIDIIYSMDEDFCDIYNYQKEFFSEFLKNHKIWQKKTTQRITNSKYHAGASNLVNRTLIKKAESDSLPTPLIHTNVEIPHISCSNLDLYFFPERLVLRQNKKYAAVFYRNLKISEFSTRFIEDNQVPKDATIVDHTWKYVNKSGGPDRRFNGNHQIPICNYFEYHLECDNGINEIFVTSRKYGMNKFANFINEVGKFQHAYEQLG